MRLPPDRGGGVIEAFELSEQFEDACNGVGASCQIYKQPGELARWLCVEPRVVP